VCWPRWCAEQIFAADVTLLVCTETYRKRFLGLDAFGQGRGVKWEAKVIQNILYYSEVNTGFVPVILRAEDEEQIPETIRDASHYLVPEATAEDAGYLALRERLTECRAWPPLALPEPDRQPRPSDASVPTEAVWDASERIVEQLDNIRKDQQSHERKSRRRHWSLAALILIAIIGLGWLGWQQ